MFDDLNGNSPAHVEQIVPRAESRGAEGLQLNIRRPVEGGDLRRFPDAENHEGHMAVVVKSHFGGG